MSSAEVFDLVVIGGGPGGYVAAIRAAQLGMKTACVEKDATLGGTCLNVGCIPSKALLDSSEHYHHVQHKLQKHGIKVAGVELDIPQMMKRKDDVVRGLTQGIAGIFKKRKITHLQGFGKLGALSGDLKTVEVHGAGGIQSVQAKNVIIATGSEPTELPFLKFDGKDVVSSTEALSFAEVPRHLVVIGGGVIGLELGSVWGRLGAKVTVVEFLELPVPGFDEQMRKELKRILEKQGIGFRLSTKCLGATKKGNTWVVDLEDRTTQEKSSLECDKILVAVGRRPFTKDLGLEKAGIKTDDRGRIATDPHFKTNVAGVFAIGDVITGPMLAHKAEEEGIAVVELIAGQAGHVNYDVIPGVVYTWPELASVGLTEEDARKKAGDVRVGTFPFLANGRAKAMDEIDGLVKIIADAKTDRILGGHILGPRASEMIAEIAAVMEFGGSAEDLARTCHAHPTLPEVTKEAALAVAKRQIHI